MITHAEVANQRPNRACSLSGRDQRLPVIYEAFNHPLTQSGGGRSFYARQSLDDKAMQEALNLEKSLKIPLGNAEKVSGLGKSYLLIHQLLL